MRDPILIGAVTIVVISGALSTLEALGRPNIGFEMDGTHQVRVVRPGSPAQAAGVQSGDVLKSVNSILITDTKKMEVVYLEAGGLAPGTYSFERGGQTVDVEIQRGSLSTRQFALVLAATFIGLVFVGLPIWAYFTAPGTPTVLLAVFGLAFGSTIMGAPTFESPAIRIAAFNMMWLLALLGAAALLHFLLTFPSPVRLVARWRATILYVPVAMLVFTSGRSMRIMLWGLAFLGLYLLAGVIALLWRYLGATSAERTAHGLRLMLVSVIVVGALLPVYLALARAWPTIWLPWESFALTATVLIPIGFSRAVVRSATNGLRG